MNVTRLLVALTVFNALLLILSFARLDAVAASDVAAVLRGRALEIVDDRGRIRATLSVLPADPAVRMPDGTTGYPETVLLRLMTAEGRPNVKLSTTEDGAGLGLGGESNPTYVQVLARGGSTSLKLTDKDGREELIKP